MLLWDSEQVALIDDATQRARDGVPTVLVVEGEAGVGKTSFLDEVVERAAGFQVREADGIETADLPPLDVFAQWGVPPIGGDAAGKATGRSPTSAAQALSGLFNATSADGPLLLRLDDLQWADPESVAALTWTLRRSSGDRLLVAVATRPLPAERHGDWQRWLSARHHAEILELDGLDLIRTTKLVRATHAELDDAAIKDLWTHTAGNPLYLETLLRENSTGELMEMRVLPAPVEFEQNVAKKIAALAADSRTILNAAAVLGTGWRPMFDIQAIADVPDPDSGVAALVAGGMLGTRDLGMGVSVRFPNSMSRSAVYAQIPLPARRALHARAAGVVRGVEDVFEQRIAAADRYDDELANELEEYARVLHDELTHRSAAAFLRAASSLSSDAKTKQLRWLDSLYDSALAQDLLAVRVQWHEIEYCDDTARRNLILGAISTFAEDNQNAIYWLTKELADTESSLADDEGFRYKIEVLLAWARVQSGAPTELVREGVERAAQLEPKDPALSSWEFFARGLVALRTQPMQSILDQFAAMPENPVAVPWSLRFQQGWRGCVRAIAGDTVGATADLNHVLSLEEEGALEASAPYFVAVLGFAQWLSGDWGMARVSLRLSQDLAGESVATAGPTLLPLSVIGQREDDRADAMIADVEDHLLSRDPWVEALDLRDIVRVVRLHAKELQHGARAAEYERLREPLRTVRSGELRKSSIWFAHVALAAIWAGELGDAEDLIQRIADPASGRMGWTDAMCQWLFGLIAEARGKAAEALTNLSNAAADDAHSLRAYRAHMLVDFARVAHLTGDVDAARKALDEALVIYESMGASVYVNVIDALRAGTKPTAAARVVTVLLTDREQDVLTLAASGMSYAQIARDLFVSQSTVSYHLSNIYRKAGVGSRHELTEMVRANPMAFGVA